MSNKIEKKVEAIIEQVILDQPEIELVDVEYVKEKERYLRIYIDKKGGIGIDDCQKISEKVGEQLDRDGVINEAYVLEVSSPGLDRVLKKQKDFEREKGKKVEIKFYEPVGGTKKIIGTLLGCDNNMIQLEEMEPIEMDKVAQVRLYVEI